MKKTLCMLLACLIVTGMLSSCSKSDPAADQQTTSGSFEPETTAVAGGLTQAIEEVQEAQEDVPAVQPVIADAIMQEIASDAAIESIDVAESTDVAAEAVSANVQPVMADATLEPVAAPTVSSSSSNSHTSIDGYSTIGDVGLEFTFSYPVNWNNMPGRSTVCYVQPMTEGVKYPARVAVTMKKLPHKANSSKLKEQFASYFKYISSQYDEETFEANMNLNTKTRFMGRGAFSTTYLAYDGEQEIMGYAICTYFERYMFVFHFLCAYEDYNSFKPAMEFMRDSVRTTLTFDDD